MKYKSKDTADMIKIGKDIVGELGDLRVVELIGDVGAGKTTIAKGIAQSLGVKENITSPSFSISNFYAASPKNLAHYDFYRLSDPGIMRDELAEAISDASNFVVIEWGESVANILPATHAKIIITKNTDSSRTVELVK